MKRLILIVLLIVLCSGVSAEFEKVYPCNHFTLRLPGYVTNWGGVVRSPCHWTIILPDAGRSWILRTRARVPLTITPLDANCEYITEGLSVYKRAGWTTTARVNVLAPCQFEVSLDVGFPILWIFNLREVE